MERTTKETTAAAHRIEIPDTLEASVFDLSSVQFGVTNRPRVEHSLEESVLFPGPLTNLLPVDVKRLSHKATAERNNCVHLSCCGIILGFVDVVADSIEMYELSSWRID